MPENVVFTKRDEASKYASEVDGQVVGDDAGGVLWGQVIMKGVPSMTIHIVGGKK